MAIINFIDPLAALETLFLGKQEPNDATRLKAQQQVRAITEGRVYRGRKPGDNRRKDTILLSITGNIPEIVLSGEDDCTDTLVLVRCLSNSDYRAALLNEAVRQLITTYKGTVTAPDGDVVIGGIFLQDKDAPEPEPPDDGAPWFEFEYNSIWRIAHSQVSPTGFN